MPKSINIFKWYDGISASFIFFTRLPLWRIYQPPKQSYSSVVEHWPLTGWLTAGIMCAVIYFGSMVFPWAVALLLAIISRLLVTGALHEDGLADFIDGFGGGGNDRRRILDIMKDSHIGTYGVIGLITYFALLFSCLYQMKPFYAMLTVLAADPFSKMVTSQLILMMPYARDEETSKAHVIYRKWNVRGGISLFVQGMLPVAPLLIWGPMIRWDVLIFVPCIVMYFLYLLIWRRLRGYTGDCCGAVCLLVELSVYVTMAAYMHLNAM
jgi:adenosylcobinamide-GDP ribazoletransferase